MTREEIIQSGWFYQEQHGLDHIYHKGFDGNRWSELITYDNGNITINRKRVTDSTAARVHYFGGCDNIEDLNFLCKLLAI